MYIESLRIKNYRALQDVTMKNLPRLCVIVGANGTGKSTLFDVFAFLRDCFTGNVRQALDARGRFAEVVSRGHEAENILIEMQFRLLIAAKERLVTYTLEIGQERNRPVVRQEALRYKRGRYGAPYYFLRFKNGEGYAINNEEDFNKKDEDLEREFQKLSGADTLAIKGIGQFERFKAAAAFRQFIESWHLSNFHISDARGRKEATGEREHLTETGNNLPLVAQYLREEEPATFDKILSQLKHRVPGIDAITTELTPDGYLLIRFADGSFKTPFLDRYVSDGTIKMLAYLVLLYDPRPHPLLCVEEPENQLYPSLMTGLAEEFRLYANRGGQVIISTHSPDFLNAIHLNEAYWLNKQSGTTQVRRAADDAQITAYMKDGDKLGYLWKQGFFEGADPQ